LNGGKTLLIGSKLEVNQGEKVRKRRRLEGTFHSIYLFNYACFIDRDREEVLMI
jgi:hypothetical protein